MGEGGGCCPPMDLFRSEAMHLVQVIIPIESARLTVSYLGDIGLIQFKDLNTDKSPFQRTYAGQIKRCAELARKLRFFKDQMSKAGVKPSAKSDAKADFNLDDVEARMQEMKEKEVNYVGNGDANSHVCKVCFESPTAAMLLPCRHFSLCKSCSLACSECPICRTKITDRIFAFAS